MCTEEADFPFFTGDEPDEIAHHSEILALNTAIEHSMAAALDREMQTAGFARVDNDRLARFAVPESDWGAVAYTRNGLVACHRGDEWRIYAQGTGQFLTNLPDQVSVVRRFVREAEQIRFWPLAGVIDAAQRALLQSIVGEAVEDEIALGKATRLRLKGWQTKRAGRSPMINCVSGAFQERP